MVLILTGATAATAGPRAYVRRGDNSIAAIDVANPTAAGTPIPIVGLSPGDILVGIDFRPMNGFLYGLGFNSGCFRLSIVGKFGINPWVSGIFKQI